MSYRKRYEFWLDMDKRDEAELARVITELKANRLFSQTIRDGIYLMWALRQGDTTALEALFPSIHDAYSRQAGVSLDDLNDLKALILQQQNTAQSTVKPTIRVQDNLDEGITVTESTADEDSIMANLLNF